MKTPDYKKYPFSMKEWLGMLVQGISLLFCICFLFYNSIILILVISPLLYVYYLYVKKRCIRRRKQALIRQFRDGILSVYSFVAAGATLERAFCQTEKDLLLCYQSEDDIVKEFQRIQYRLQMNMTIESCIKDFADRTELEDIQNFSEVITIAKRSGGSMREIIKNTVDTIGQKIEIEQEIETMISGKKHEFRIMAIIPAGIIGYLRIFSPGFMDVLYQDVAGRVVMTVCMLFYGIALFIGNRMTNIRL